MDLLPRNQSLFCSSSFVNNNNYSPTLECWPTNQFLFHPYPVIGTGLHSTAILEFYNFGTFFRSLQYGLRITVFMA